MKFPLFVNMFMIVAFQYFPSSCRKLNSNYIRIQNNSINVSEITHDLIFAVKQLNLEKLEEILMSVSDPTSLRYGEYLNSSDVAKVTGNPTGYKSIINFLHTHNIKIIKETIYGEFITAQTTIANWQSLLSTEFHSFQHKVKSDSIIYRAPYYTLPSHLEPHISCIFNLVHLPLSTTSITPKHKLSDQSAPFISPSLLNSHYNIPYNTGNMTIRQTIYSAIGQYFSPANLATFQATFNIPSHPVDSDENNRANDAKCVSSPDDCGESNLDLQYMMAIAQNTHTSIIYDSNDDAFVSWITHIASTPTPSLVYSISYGIQESELEEYESFVDAFNIQAMKLGVMGVTVVVASGDDGAPGPYAQESSYECGYDPSFPATSPYVLSVGATMGLEYGTEEVVCDANKGGVITSGGGFSNMITALPLQRRAVNEYFANVESSPKKGYTITGRAFPDVALSGHNYKTCVGNNFYATSGTSASTPTVAGMISLLNAARKTAGLPSVGWMAPVLYASNGSFANDITSGNNKCTEANCCKQGFHAAKGWDPTTGFGSIDFTKLYTLYLGVSIPTASPTVMPSFPRLSALPTGIPTQSTTAPSYSPTISPTLIPSTTPSLTPTTTITNLTPPPSSLSSLSPSTTTSNSPMTITTTSNPTITPTSMIPTSLPTTYYSMTAIPTWNPTTTSTPPLLLPSLPPTALPSMSLIPTTLSPTVSPFTVSPILVPVTTTLPTPTPTLTNLPTTTIPTTTSNSPTGQPLDTTTTSTTSPPTFISTSTIPPTTTPMVVPTRTPMTQPTGGAGGSSPTTSSTSQPPSPPPTEVDRSGSQSHSSSVTSTKQVTIISSTTVLIGSCFFGTLFIGLVIYFRRYRYSTLLRAQDGDEGDGVHAGEPAADAEEGKNNTAFQVVQNPMIPQK